MSKRIEEIDDFDVWFMHEHEGMSHQEIADYYGVSPSTIRFRLHPDKKKENNEKSKDCKKEYTRNYYHSDKGRENMKLWRQSEKGKESDRKQHAKRRGLGSIELNLPFPNSEGHHIDEEYIIHIPKELHRSIWHNVFTGQGMEEINTIAFGYINEDTFDNLLSGVI